MSTRQIYRIGVVGCGKIWGYHKLAIEHSSRLQCTYVYDPVGKRAQSAADTTGARIAGSAAEVCEAKDVDIVAILTPAFTHAELVEVAAGAGKHLMLEKPMANTLQDAERIVSAIHDSGVKCFHPTLRALGSDMFQKLQELTAPEGLLGPARCGFYHVVSAPFDWAAWFKDRTRCLPPAENASHFFDTFMALTGHEPVSVWSQAGKYCRDFDQDDVTIIIINFSDGRYFQMTLNWVLKSEWEHSATCIHFVCDRGVIVHKGFSAEWYSVQGCGEYASTRTATQGDRWEHYHSLIDAIEKGTDISPNEHDGYRYMRILDAAARSRDTGGTIFLERKTKETPG